MTIRAHAEVTLERLAWTFSSVDLDVVLMDVDASDPILGVFAPDNVVPGCHNIELGHRQDSRGPGRAAQKHPELYIHSGFTI